MAIGDKKPVIMEADIGVEGGVPPYLHASQHSVSGADPITLDMIGAASADLSNVSNEDMLTKIESSGFVGGSNPNLLDNWYFADPIDQRGGWVVPPGKTYYITGSEVGGTTDEYYAATLVVESADYSYWAITVDGATRYVAYADAIRGYTGAGYGIDRWKAPANTTLMIRDGYVHLEFAAMYDSIIQRFESGAIREGVYTLSVLTPQGYYAWTFTASKTAPAQSPIGWFGVTNLYSYFNYEQDGTAILYVIDNAADGTNSCDIIAAKLELGSAQTLAHQDEDGNWVLNDPPPNKALELAKCHRYFYTFDFTNWPGVSAYWGRGISDTEIELYNMTFPVTMRINPAVNTLKIYDSESGRTYDVVSNGHYHKKEGLRAIGVSSGMTVTVDKMYLVTKAQFSADL